jgi:C_GCAxxG_C_C family probable redox protein
MKEMSKNDAFLDEIEEKGERYDREYRGCAQSVLRTLQEAFGHECNEVFKTAFAFGGGLARMKSVCGALVGGYMGLGLEFGRGWRDFKENPWPTERRLKVYKDKFQKLFKKFVEEYGSDNCYDIIGFDLNDPEDYQEFQKRENHVKCEQRCGKVARWAAELILEG